MPQTSSAIVQGKSVPALVISMQSPPDMIVGQPFSYTFQAIVSGGTQPYGPITYVGNNLPNGVTLNGSTGVMSGTPTNVVSYTVTASTTDSGN